MLKGSNSIRVIVLAALVLAVALSSTVASRFAGGDVTLASKQSRARAVEEHKLNSAWQTQLSTEQSQLQQAQQQQAAAAANAKATLTPAPTPSPSPTPTPAPTSAPPSSGSVPSQGTVESIIESVFQPLGATAVQWGLCIAYHESGDNPSSVQQGGGGAEGLFQFEPATWAGTPEGEAGDSVFDATANAEAAAWEYGDGNYSAWTTNADYCSQYD